MSLAAEAERDTGPAPGAGWWGRRQSTLLWVVPLVIAVLLPGLQLQTYQTLFAFRWAEYRVVSTIVALVAAALVAILHFAGRRSLRRSLSITAALLIVLFHWPSFSAIGTAVAIAARWQFLGDVAAVATAIGVTWIASRLGDEIAFPVVTGVALAAIAMASVLTIGGRFVGPDGSPRAVADGGGTPMSIVLLDEYGRGDVLEQVYGVDNSVFAAELSRRGFTMYPEATAAYNRTYASLGAMLDLDYPLEAGPIDDAERGRIRDLLAGDNRLFDLFHQAGYRITYLENGWAGSRCGGSVDRCVRSGLWATSGWRLGLLTIARPVVMRYLPHPFTSQGGLLLAELGDIVTDVGSGVSLTFAHINLPHTPLMLDEACGLIVGRHVSGIIDGRSPAEVAAVSQALHSQLTCVNRRLLAALDQIIAADADTIIVVTGDHGPEPVVVRPAVPASEQVEAVRARLGTLLAVRLPERCAKLSLPTPTNAIRRATDCALGTELGEIAPRWFLAPPDHERETVQEVQYPQERP